MGVDYDANYGIGYKVTEGDGIDEDELEDGLIEYISENLGDDFEYFEVGSGSYSGETDDCYIAIKRPFKDGLDLTDKKKDLDDELKRMKLEPIGEFNEVGGLNMW